MNTRSAWTAAGMSARRRFPKRGRASQAETILEGMGSCLDAINPAADAKLKKKLIICRGCMPPELDDQTGSITPK
jgi:hypothetical protein